MLIFTLLIMGRIYFGEAELEKAEKRYRIVEALRVFSAIKQWAVNQYTTSNSWSEATQLLEQVCNDDNYKKTMLEHICISPKFISRIKIIHLQYIFYIKESTHIKLTIRYVYVPIKKECECHGEGEDSALFDFCR